MDAHLRQLQRDASSGDLQAQARLLRERARIGDLDLERLEFAAYLKHPAARQALGSPPDQIQTGLVRVEEEGPTNAQGELWVSWIRRMGRVPALLVLKFSGGVHATRSPVLSALRAWCRCPCEAHALAIEDCYRPRGAERGAIPEQLPGWRADVLAALRGDRFPELSGVWLELTSHEARGILRLLRAWALDDQDSLELLLDARP